jgi:Domain of unknown function (DUF4388)
MTRGNSNRDSTPVVLRTARTASGERPALRYAEGERRKGAELESAGFSATCQNTSLADWIQLIQMGRRDAVIIVRTDDREGRLWCKGGDIIDARWERLAGEEAVYGILACETGDVSVNFGGFERPRTIHTPTSGLLLEAAYQKDSVNSETWKMGAHTAAFSGTESRTSTAPPPAEPTLLLPDPSRTRQLRRWLWAAPLPFAFLFAFWIASRADPGARAAAPSTAPTAVSAAALPNPNLERPAPAPAPNTPATLPVEPARSHSESAPAKARHTQVTRRPSESVPDAKATSASLPTTPAPQPRIEAIDERRPRIRAIDEAEPRIQGLE